MGVVCLVTGCPGFGDETLETGPTIPTWDGQIRDVFARNCVRCHTSPPKNGAPPSFRYDKYTKDDLGDGLDGAFEKRARIKVRAVEAKTMPPDGAVVTDADRALLGAWIDGGAPRTATAAVGGGQ